jgi:hypothetical protein
MKRPLQAAALLLLLSMFGASLSTAFAQGTAFTYQGRLNNNGIAASGLYDFQFSLSNAPSGGSQIGSTVMALNVPVTNGLFTTTIDFGSVLSGQSAWLAISVRTNGASTYAGLTPLQSLSPAPYAVFANTASNVSGTLPAAQISGTIPPANFSGIYGNVLNLSNANNTIAGSFSGNGAGVTGVSAASLNGLGAANFWQTAGNSGTAPGINFLGTTDNQPLEFRVNNKPGLRLQSGNAATLIGSAPPGLQGAISILGGLDVNSITSGAQGATIAGGGAVTYINAAPNPPVTLFSSNTIVGLGNVDGGTIGGGMGNTLTEARAGTVSGGENNTGSDEYTVVAGGNHNTASGDTATIGGGQNNVASGRRGVVPGGDSNIAGGNESLASGRGAQANFDGNFVWADSFGQAALPVTFASSGIDQFLIRAGGGVGINTNNPHGAALFVNGATTVNGSLTATSITGNGGGLTNVSGANVSGVALLNSANAFSAASNSFSGNVGIGTTTPTSALAVNGNIFMGTQRNNNVFTQVGDTIYLGAEQKYLGNTLKTAIGGSTDWINLMANGISAGILFGTSGPSTADPHTGASALMVIKPSGLVGIGTATPAKKLDVTGSASSVGVGGSVESSIIMRLNNTNSDGTVSSPDYVGIGFGQNSTRSAIVSGTFGNDVLDFYTGGTLTSPKMRIDFSGHVGIGTGTTNLTHPLDMASGAFCSAGGVWTSVSDRNVKEDFTRISPTEVLSRVAAMPITEWKYKVEPNGTEHIGPMAQDFHAAFGLNGDDDKHIASVDESGVALAAIQGLNQKLEEKDLRISELEKRLAKLEQLLSAKIGIAN